MFSVLKPSQSTLFSGKIYLSKPYGRYQNFTKESFVLFKTIALELVKNKNYLIFIILFTVLVQKYDKYLTDMNQKFLPLLPYRITNISPTLLFGKIIFFY